MESATVGEHTIVVDDEDVYLLELFAWRVMRIRHKFYAYTSVITARGRRSELMHRMILRAGKGVMVDHKDGNGLNNCRANLRQCNHSQNATNSRAPTGTRKHKWDGPLYRGVQRKPEDKGKFSAWIGFNKKVYRLGGYATAEEAARAYDAKAREFHGEFATLNFP